MHYFFFDASGDPGFDIYSDVKQKSRPNLFYVQCVISVSDKDKDLMIQKVVDLRKTFGYGPTYEFKYSKLPENKKPLFFEEIIKLDFSAYIAVLDKINSGAKASLLNIGGSNVTNKILAPLIADALPGIPKFHCTVDKENDSREVIRKLRGEISKELRARNITSVCDNIKPGDSKQFECLQVADMFAGIVADGYKNSNPAIFTPVRKKITLKLI